MPHSKTRTKAKIARAKSGANRPAKPRREYWRNPEATARAFADGRFRTGDSGSRDAEGTYWFAARIKDIIVRNTAKLTPGENAEALTRFLETRLARYKIPGRYFFITALPLTRSGKIDHKALRAIGSR